MGHGASGLLDGLLHNLARVVGVLQRGREEPSQRRAIGQMRDQFLRHAAFLINLDCLQQQARRGDLLAAQAVCSFVVVGFGVFCCFFFWLVLFFVLFLFF